MHYYIDGYNLLFRLVRSDKDFTRQRQELIEDLYLMIRETGMNATLVFDAYYQLGEGSRSNYRELAVQFTASKETADEFIIEALEQSPDCSKETVVTSDKKLAWYARRSRAKTETVEAFTADLKRRYKNKIDPKKKTILLKRELKTATPLVKQSSPEDLYLEQFEARFKELAENAAKKAKPLQEKKRYKKVEETEKILDEQSEMDRWLKIFQSKQSPESP